MESEDSEQSLPEDEEEQSYFKESREHSDGRHQRVTDVENALPATQSDEAAFEAYEEYKSSQAAAKEEQSESVKPLWIKGRSSIYVDAFNLALDTVLEEEANLFDDCEIDVFDQWKTLDYEAQYL